MATATWEVRGVGDEKDRYVRWVEGRREADDATDLALDVALARGGVPVTPTGPMYLPVGADDATGVFLAALNVLGLPLVSGTPPAVPDANGPGDIDDDRADGPGEAPEREVEGDAQPGSPALVASLVFRAFLHAECDEEFCRNGTAPGERKVHPGPCRGWKEQLRRVAPGALDIIEGERRRKLAERRAGGTGGQRSSQVVSDETRAAVAAAVAALPRDEVGWHAVVGRTPGTVDRRVDRELREAYADLPAAREARERALDQAREQARQRRPTASGRRRRTLSESEEQWAQAQAQWSFELGGRELTDLEARIRNLEQIRDIIDAADAAGTEVPADAQWLADVTRGPNIPGDYPRDPAGNRMPPPELAALERTVTDAGRALAADIDRAVRDDPEVRRLEAQAQRALDMRADVGRLDPQERVELFRETGRMRQEAERGINRRRHDLTLQALSELRPMGGERHTNVTAGPDARDDWRERMGPTDQHFPDDWVRRSAGRPLSVTSSDRAYYQGGYNGWETVRGGGTLAMNTDSGAAYQGGFADYIEEVNVHEMGHRMEQQIPGLRALEFAWVRRHTTGPDGHLEPTQRLADLRRNSGYEDYEVARPDRFNEPYTGRDYAVNSQDPAASSWEAFQVGLQEAFGSTREFSGESDLVPFTLGALATLGRAS